MLIESIKEYDVMSEGKSGTSLQGYVNTTFFKLKELFGEPTYNDADPTEKVNMEWVLDVKYYEEGNEDIHDYEYHTVSIYNWKTGYVPFDEYEWHVGGNSWVAEDIVKMIIAKGIKPDYNYND